MAKIAWSVSAEKDLREIERFIARDSIQYACLFIDKIIERTMVLQQTPELGRIVPETENSIIRELIYRNYRIIYYYDKMAITILRVFHSSRLLNLHD